jgi:hypothetical protein
MRDQFNWNFWNYFFLHSIPPIYKCNLSRFCQIFWFGASQQTYYKLRSFGINGKLIQWINSFLIGRKQRVTINNTSSDWVDVFRGVSQGSVLGCFFPFSTQTILPILLKLLRYLLMILICFLDLYRALGFLICRIVYVW